MATFTGRTPQDTYGGLFNIDNSNMGIDTTLRIVQDGLGNATPLKMSTTRTTLTSDLGVGTDFPAARVHAHMGPSGATDIVDSVYIAESNGEAFFQIKTPNGFRKGIFMGDVVNSADTAILSNATGNLRGLDYSTAGVNTVRMLSDGNVTQPRSCRFLATDTTAKLNVTGDGTVFTCLFENELTDIGSNYDSVSTFTAPVTGTYHLGATVQLGQFTVAHTTGLLDMVTTFRSYRLVDTSGNISDAGTNGIIAGSIMAPMTAGDTATVAITAVGSTKTVDQFGGGTCYFWGYLFA